VEIPICQICGERRAAVRFSVWRAGRFYERTSVCLDCASVYERLRFGGLGKLGDLTAEAALVKAKEVGIDPKQGCPGCGASLADILTETACGCEMCYSIFYPDIVESIAAVQGWKSHVGKYHPRHAALDKETPSQS